MKNIRHATILYILIALFAGLIVGLVLQGVQTIFILAVIALAGIAAIIRYMNSDEIEKHLDDTAEPVASKDEKSEEEVLSKEESRQWLDDFLVEHQKHMKKPPEGSR
ncbi:MAG: hypothetical protein WD200_04010 [Candidatus Andersenbacteria bacterium]